MAQVALLSAQHCIPQAALPAVLGQADLLAQHLEDEQPATKAQAQTVRARSLSDFMVVVLFILTAAPSVWLKTTRSLEGARTEEV